MVVFIERLSVSVPALKALHALTHAICVDVIPRPILYMKELRLREVKQLSQGHTQKEWRSWNSNQARLTPWAQL